MSFPRVKPLVDDDDNDECNQENVVSDSVGPQGGSEPEISGGDDGDMSGSDNELKNDDDDMDMEEEESDEEERPNAQDAISHISFGTLAKAQKSIAKERRKSQPISKEDRVAATRAQLAALKESQGTKPRKTREELKRSSKHAPQEISSKRAVTRRREAIAPIIPAVQAARDPRFDTAVKGVYDEKVFKKNYSFLNNYREDEMKALKQEISKSKDEWKKEQLKKELLSMESKRKAEKDKEQAENVVREHRKKERELIKQGKKPFYLKKAEQKKLLLMEKYSKLNEKQLEKVIEKKRKRKSQKERKSVPFERRAG